MELKERKMKGRSSPETVSTKLRQIAELGRKAPGMVLTTLAHHIDVEFLREAYKRTRKDGAVGVDGRTAKEYAENLEENLESLLNRFKSGSYYAPPVRRVYVPKGRGKKRPIGIPTFEDKVLQRAVTMVMEAVYEQDFLNCSYGFRPKRSAHDALAALRKGIRDIESGWVLEVDIQSYFDTMSRKHLRDFLDQRVRDGVIRRTIHKWMKAGVMESGNVWYAERGSPQGAVISPLLANIYLHEVMDRWFEQEVQPRLKGRTVQVRYADDLVIAFEREEDARRVMEVLPMRFGKYGLTLHPEKTRLVRFERPKGTDSKGPGSFDFLGFTHYWGKSRKGVFVVKKKTAKDRFRRSMMKIDEWCRRNRHMKIAQQHEKLRLKVKGHYGYYGVTGNIGALKRFRMGVERTWRKWLNRRSSGRHMPWDRFKRLLERYPLPPPCVVHSVYSPAAKPCL
jgi:RNA-directed DNA polymerase